MNESLGRSAAFGILEEFGASTPGQSMTKIARKTAHRPFEALRRNSSFLAQDQVEGPGAFAPIPPEIGLSRPPVRPAPLSSILSQNRSGRTIPNKA
jgi:hypothetical protein